MDPTVTDLIARLTNASATTLMVIFIVAIFKNLIVPKSNFDKLIDLYEKRYSDLEEVCQRQQEEIREWKVAALRSLEVAKQVVPAAIQNTATPPNDIKAS